MNRAILLGRLGKDPELRHTSSGTAVINFSLATSRKYKTKSGAAKEETQWHQCNGFGKTAEIISQYFSKGDQILLEGMIQYRNYDDRDGNKKYVTEILIDRFEFVGANKERSQESQEHQDRVDEPGFDPDEEIPF